MLRSNNGHSIYRNVSHVRPYFRTFERNTHCDNRQNLNRNYSAILAILQITSYALGV
jgi:hypothetical protein